MYGHRRHVCKVAVYNKLRIMNTKKCAIIVCFVQLLD